MRAIFKKRFDQAEDVRPFADNKGELAMLDLDGASVGKATFQPGWRWSDHVKPIAGTDSCEAAHAGYVITGHMTVRMNDGTEVNFDPGDVMVVQPGHDAWVVGQEPCVVIDWQGYTDYAKPTASSRSAKA
ncbi:MAG: cupin [Frankiales bacterium]|nr:cupin [Frankiales bacterium]